jgi:3-hydroxybutyryl-CoA dehydrogenase
MNADRVKRIAVIGAGLMGHGIALEFAAAGFPVRIFDSDPQTLASALGRARGSAALLVEAGKIRLGDVPDVLGRIQPAASIEAAARDADVVVEAVFEDLDIKRQVFAALDRAAPAPALLLSNSSAFMPSQLAAATERPGQVAVAHYFDPPYLLPLVELVRGPKTSAGTIETARRLYQRIGKRPVVIEKEMPGFAGNRLQGALGREARALADAGVATPEDIDAVVKYGFGRRLAVAGPFEVLELIGWDLVSVIGGEIWKDISRSTGAAAPGVIPGVDAAGARAKQTGRPQPEESADALRARMERMLIEMARWDADRGPISSQSPSPRPFRQAPSTRSGWHQGDASPSGRGLEKHPGINRVAVIGAGLMGHGIALEFAAAGYDVTYTDRASELLETVPVQARQGLGLLAEAGRIKSSDIEDILLRMRPCRTLAEAARGAGIAVEAVSGNLELKRSVFTELDAAAPKQAILLSNTSTFLPSALASATTRPGSVAVAHYFNPPHLLPVVEVVRGPQTSDSTVGTVVEVYRRMGKVPALVQKEVLGFVGIRLQFAMFREALSLVQKGVISAPALDEVVRNSFGRRLPAVGLFARRTLLSQHLASRSGNEVMPTLDNFTEVPPVLAEKVRRGELGTKTGKGFYEWTPESAEALRLRVGRALVEMAKWDA